MNWLWLVAAAALMGTDRPPSADAQFVPDPATVRRFGPAYRFPQAGWIVLHIEGEPYERGYQHGHLLAEEIERYIKALAGFRSKSPTDGWNDMRMLCNALFLRGYDAEFLEEMKGIADGAAAAGAKFDGRAVDLIDIVAVNSDIEVEFLDGALDATAHGLEGRRFLRPTSSAAPRPREPHCSAFAANGPATANGKIVFGHITMWNLKYVRHFNVWLDVKPKAGQRVVMQTYPAGIMSGMDYYMSDAGLLVAETTIAQTRFESNAKPLASRIRKALQYSKSIDDLVATLASGNNGLYSNEWLLADIKSNEIAMFELGTSKRRLWRSGKDEWIGGHRGFYWGCNNARDPEVRAETQPSLLDRPANLTFRPSDRDCKWLDLFRDANGKISEAFGFVAFTTPPLAAFSSLDAKFTTADLAKDMKSWCLFGNPLGRTWEPLDDMKARFPGVRPLVGNEWTLIAPAASTDVRSTRSLANDLPGKAMPSFDMGRSAGTQPPRWRGTILPSADGDVWLAAAFAEFHKIAAWQHLNPKRAPSLGKEAPQRLDALMIARWRSKAFAATLRQGVDVNVLAVKSSMQRNEWYDAAVGKGVLMLDLLRRRVGGEKFDEAMDSFGIVNAGKKVESAQFVAHLNEKIGHSIDLKALEREVVGETPWATSEGPTHWSIDSFEAELPATCIVVGTSKEAGIQSEAAQKLQRWIARKWSNIYVPIIRDLDLTDKLAANNHLLLIGRPSTNVAYARVGEKLPVVFGRASVQIGELTLAHEETAVIVAGANARNRRYSVVGFAGLSGEATWHCVDRYPGRGEEGAPAMVVTRLQTTRPLLLANQRGNPAPPNAGN